jgi:hypothetical protein
LQELTRRVRDRLYDDDIGSVQSLPFADLVRPLRHANIEWNRILDVVEQAMLVSGRRPDEGQNPDDTEGGHDYRQTRGTPSQCARDRRGSRLRHDTPGASATRCTYDPLVELVLEVLEWNGQTGARRRHGL